MSNKAVMRRFYDEVVNEGKLEVIDEIVSPDLIDHDETPGSGGREGFREFVAMFRLAFPDTKWIVEDLIEEGDKVVARVKITGTQKGEFMGMPASGRPIEVATIDIVRFAGGKAAEHWGTTDSGSMMMQLGAMEG
jgi:steroid delta-isomerase-like uncharacterized protein